MTAEEADALCTRLYQEHYPRILSRASYLLSNHHEAEEIAQDTFMSAWRYLDSLDDERKVLPWLYTIVNHKCTDVIRRRKLASFSSLDVHLDLMSSLPDVADEATSVLERALEPLSTDERMVCVLAGQKYKMQEIAEMMGKTLTAVKMISSRGKGKLRQKYMELVEGVA